MEDEPYGVDIAEYMEATNTQMATGWKVALVHPKRSPQLKTVQLHVKQPTTIKYELHFTFVIQNFLCIRLVKF